MQTESNVNYMKIRFKNKNQQVINSNLMVQNRTFYGKIR